jgi:hypothetical protein
MCILYNQRDATYTMFFIIISAVHVSGGFSAHHQRKTAGKHDNTQGCTLQFYNLLMMGGKPARNM